MSFTVNNNTYNEVLQIIYRWNISFYKQLPYYNIHTRYVLNLVSAPIRLVHDQ